MDRPIDEIIRRRRLLRRVMIPGFAVVVGLGSLASLRAWIRPSVSSREVLIATVDRGPVEATLAASGSIEPDFEEVITSPIDSRVLEVLARPGAQLSIGQPILRLDVGETMAALGKLDDQIALKKNQQKKLRLDLENQLITLKSDWERNKLDLAFLESKNDQNERLRADGLVSKEDALQSRLAADKAAVVLKQLEDTRSNAQTSVQTQLEALALEMTMLRREREEVARQLELATTKADRAGVLTWVVPEEGSSVHRGDSIAKIADLTSFRVRATLSDIHAARLSAGLPVKVRIEGAELTGRITSVLPTISGGIVTVLASLDDSSHAGLKPNLRADVYVVAATKAGALRIRKGPGVSGSGKQELYVVRGARAVRTPVGLGLAGADVYEVVDGLSEGDKVIVSDMREYAHLQEVVVR